MTAVRTATADLPPHPSPEDATMTATHPDPITASLLAAAVAPVVDFASALAAQDAYAAYLDRLEELGDPMAPALRRCVDEDRCPAQGDVGEYYWTPGDPSAAACHVSGEAFAALRGGRLEDDRRRHYPDAPAAFLALALALSAE